MVGTMISSASKVASTAVNAYTIDNSRAFYVSYIRGLKLAFYKLNKSVRSFWLNSSYSRHFNAFIIVFINQTSCVFNTERNSKSVIYTACCTVKIGMCTNCRNTVLNKLVRHAFSGNA